MNRLRTEDIAKEMLHDNRIVSYTPHHLDIAVLANWNAAIVESLQDWPDDGYYLSMYDLSTGGVSMPFLVLNSYQIYNLSVTQMGQQAIENVLAAKPNLKTRLALVFADTLSGNITVKRGKYSEFEGDNPVFEHRVFFDRQLAIEWLTSFIGSSDA